MQYVLYDIETDQAATDWATIIEFGAILLDKNLKEIERFSGRCRLPQDRVPSATAFFFFRPGFHEFHTDLVTYSYTKVPAPGTFTRRAGEQASHSSSGPLSPWLSHRHFFN